MNYTKHHLLEYLPKRYEATEEQISDRDIVYAFKNGYCNPSTLNSFVAKIKQITNDSDQWLICFIPASTESRTIQRYSLFAERLQKEIKCKVSLSAIFNKFDKKAGHIVGKSTGSIDGFGFRLEEFENKKILIIDDVITRGATFNAIALEIKQLGATNIIGLFLAKTIKSDWSSRLNDVNYQEFMSDEDWTVEDFGDEFAIEQPVEDFGDEFAIEQPVEDFGDDGIDNNY